MGPEDDIVSPVKVIRVGIEHAESVPEPA